MATQYTDGAWGTINRSIGLAQRIVGRVFFVLFMFIVLFIILGSFGGEPQPRVPGSGVLHWAPSGLIVEEEPRYDPEQALNNALTGTTPLKATQLHNVLRVINAAKDDDNVETLVLNLNNFAGGYPSILHEVADALHDFRESGKTIIAHSELMGQSQYLLASQASEVWLHPDGLYIADGFSSFRSYYKDILDSLRVTVNVFRVGTFKSAVEPFLETEMSPAAREANLALLDVLWDEYQRAVERGRGLTEGALQTYADTFPQAARARGGDLAMVALEAGLVDELIGRGALRSRLIERFGEDDDDGFERISFADYKSTLDKEKTSGDAIAIITASGPIMGGDGDGGTTGGDEHAALIRKARDDDDIKAIVLRVDSPGGSAFASELIREELELAKADGKPIIVSMSGLAASGGYWISTPADEIWATPTTITGSIGIFAFIPTFEDTAAWVGVNEDGVGTTRLANAISPLSGVSDEGRQIIQASIEHGYEQFLGIVGDSRGKTRDEVDSIAQGRVWAGATALELGLVDKLGDLDDAVASAAALAGLEEGEYAVRRLFNEVTPFEEIMEALGLEASAQIANAVPAPIAQVASALDVDLMWIAAMDDPKHQYLTCLECPTLQFDQPF